MDGCHVKYLAKKILKAAIVVIIGVNVAVTACYCRILC